MKKVGCFETCCEARINEMYIAPWDGLKEKNPKRSTESRRKRERKEKGKGL